MVILAFPLGARVPVPYGVPTGSVHAFYRISYLLKCLHAKQTQTHYNNRRWHPRTEKLVRGHSTERWLLLCLMVFCSWTNTLCLPALVLAPMPHALHSHNGLLNTKPSSAPLIGISDSRLDASSWTESPPSHPQLFLHSHTSFLDSVQTS